MIHITVKILENVYKYTVYPSINEILLLGSCYM